MEIIRKVVAYLRAVGAFDVSRSHLLSMDDKEAVNHSLNMAGTPFLLAFILGIVSVTYPPVVAPSFEAITEFLQLTGMKMAFYTSAVLGGFGLLLRDIPILGIRFAWLTASLAFVGFNLAATAFGVTLGLAFPAAIDLRSVGALVSFISLSLVFAGMQLAFYMLAHFVDGRYVEPRDKFFGAYAGTIGRIIGVLLVAGGIVLGLHETWPHAASQNCTQDQELERAAT